MGARSKKVVGGGGNVCVCVCDVGTRVLGFVAIDRKKTTLVDSITRYRETLSFVPVHFPP